MAKLDEQISTLEDKLKQLKLKQQRSQARQRAVEALRERKAETRRKILVGTVVMAKARDGEMDAALLRSWMDQALTRREERALFGLAAREASESGGVGRGG
jgi:hypothetical protein